ncbi:hypothetical protein [Allomesorhizobium camelthorni]|uniref:Uncharacterized protein n=1 Tax=Allomesorhizobium camelthorni TaxID=475069 RepID=A0A6G4WII7_9HYPH|nr:hypothetical protein [Mesorhizobium camelthorni]NGO53940.1 hypothetical protein [Mesorhizobium camelthorni]
MKASIFMVAALARIPPSNEAIDASMLPNITAQAASRRPNKPEATEPEQRFT